MLEDTPLDSSRFEHLPVMADVILNAIAGLPPKFLNEGLIIDATVGGGGHLALILEAHPNLRAIGLDQDPIAIEASKKHLMPFGTRTEVLETNFADFTPTEKAVFVLADLGVSSPQFDQANRGFSFRLDGPLDMRMSPNKKCTAASLIKELSEKELADLIYKFGEEKFSRRIAQKIKKDLSDKGPFKGTKDLAYSIAGCFPPKMRHGRIHAATRTFQALRIAVNDELDNLDTFLRKSPEWLHPEGILSVISFHSLEDRKVKNTLKLDNRVEKITKKPLVANSIEIENNPRSRSAKCRMVRKK